MRLSLTNQRKVDEDTPKPYYAAKQEIQLRTSLAIFQILTPVILQMLPARDRKRLIKMAKSE